MYHLSRPMKTVRLALDRSSADRWSSSRMLGAIVWLVARRRGWCSARAGLGDLRPAAPFQLAEQVRRSRGGVGDCRRARGGPTRPWVIFLHGNDANDRQPAEHPPLRTAARARPERAGAGVSRLRRRRPACRPKRGLADDARARLRLPAAAAARRADAHRHLRLVAGLRGRGRSGVARRRSGGRCSKGRRRRSSRSAQQRYPYFPIRLLIRNPFESIRKIDRIGSPVLFLHSPEDAVVPIRRRAHGCSTRRRRRSSSSRSRAGTSTRAKRIRGSSRRSARSCRRSGCCRDRPQIRTSALRDDVSMLGEMLGETLRAREGDGAVRDGRTRPPRRRRRRAQDGARGAGARGAAARAAARRWRCRSRAPSRTS